MSSTPATVEPANPAQETQEQRSGYDFTDQSKLLPFRKVVIVFMGLSLCLLVSSLDSTMVATALPSISAYFNAGSVSAWVPSGERFAPGSIFIQLSLIKLIC